MSELVTYNPRSPYNYLVTPGAVAVYSAGTEFVRSAVKRRRIERELDAAMPRPLVDQPQADLIDQSTGLRRLTTKTVFGGRKKKSVAKLLRSSVVQINQKLGLRSDTGPNYDWRVKHLVSEFNPTFGGCIPCTFNTKTTGNGNLSLPMHMYDLNYFRGGSDDNKANWPVDGGSMNSDTNSRAWYFNTSNSWYPMTSSTNEEPRWFIDNPRNTSSASNPMEKIYRKGIDIRFMLYGCTKMPTEFDVRVIRISDPLMCPDYDGLLDSTDLARVRQNWQNMIRAWTINPMLKGVEPGPKATTKWFQTVAKKRVRIGEQTSDIESVPCVQGRIYVKLNEVQNYAWSSDGFTTESGTACYDNVPVLDGDEGSNANFKHRPYYTSRYYLLIRALSPVDQNPATAGGDYGIGLGGNFGVQTSFFNTAGIPATELSYTPTYDLAVVNSFLVLKAQ